VDLATEAGVVVAEGGEAAESGLGRRYGDGAVVGEQLVQQLDPPSDAAGRDGAVEG
jgi:hypothetical protein